MSGRTCRERHALLLHFEREHSSTAGSDPFDLSRFTEAQDRLREWTRIVLTVEGRSAQEIFGYPDYLAAGRVR